MSVSVGCTPLVVTSYALFLTRSLNVTLCQKYFPNQNKFHIFELTSEAEEFVLVEK